MTNVEMLFKGRLIAQAERKTKQDKLFQVRQFAHVTKEGLFSPVNVKDYSQEEMIVGKDYEFEFFPSSYVYKGSSVVELVKLGVSRKNGGKKDDAGRGSGTI
jgi:hypothetical protein